MSDMICCLLVCKNGQLLVKASSRRSSSELGIEARNQVNVGVFSANGWSHSNMSYWSKHQCSSPMVCAAAFPGWTGMVVWVGFGC